MANLVVAADAPWIAHAVAAAALGLHIGGGSLAIASGYVSIFAKKGGRLHRLSGNVFFVSMLAMAGVGAIVSPMLNEDQWTNTTAAVFALYLTLTAWLAAKRRPGDVGHAEAALVAAPLGIAAVGLYWATVTGGSGAYSVVYAFGAVSALAAVCDLRMLRAGGLAGVARTARHLWRMSLAFFVATGSFFFGQPDFQPDWLRATPLPMIIGLGPLVLMAFWLVRVRFPRRRRSRAAAA
ncbi:hypothetical protein [Phenylobacterium sp.]|uniref:hypothetical protein n=1 Tax=Phenylobacterium sp. TaxID=1871053 RepID=UPI003BAA1AC8